MRRIIPRLEFALVGLAAALVITPLRSQEDFAFWPDANYDPAIPTFESVLGYAPGERITWHRDVMRYFAALQSAAPSRVVITEYARSWEGRQLFYAAISSAGNVAELSDIKVGMQRLADPRETTQEEAEDLIQSLPGVVWLSYAVHGNEISSTDAALFTAYHLLASRGDALVSAILENTIVVIDPLQNPDGRDRFIHHFEIAEGLVPDADPISAEHDEPWPGGRTNHYYFDLNRDWFIQTQPETKGRTEALLEWYPLAFVDAHEMGSNSTYYFAPEAIPYNPHLAQDQRASLTLFGRNNARWFDRFGFDYFTREVYDAFYPGYGASWPSYFGSVAMTYEQASTRGLVVRRYDGKDVHYRSTVRNHFVTSLATAEVVARNRQKFLTEFYDYRVSAIEEGRREAVNTYILPAQADQPAADKLAGLLVLQGLTVGQASTSFSACGQSYAADTYVIRADQPGKRLLRTLMDQNVSMEDAFIAEQERLRAKGLPDEIYDVTAWSLPLMFNVRMETCDRLVEGDFSAVGDELMNPGAVSGGTAQVAYLVPWGTAPAVRFLAGALRTGLDVKSSDKSFTHEGTVYPAGTLILDVVDNPADLAGLVSNLAAATGANPVAVDDSWVTDGPNFGSENVVAFNAPRVGIAWDLPTSANNAGATRFIIERQFDYPVTPIRVRQLATANLNRYQVLILPATSRASSYQRELGEGGIDNLRDWVNRGGVLIALGSANRFLADPAVDLLAVRREDAAAEPEEQDGDRGGPDGPDSNRSDEDGSTVEGERLADDVAYLDAIAPEKTDPDSVAGVLVRAEVDPDHWLGAGVASTLNVLVNGPDIYTPIRLDKGVNVVRFAAADELLASGYLWEENRLQLAYKPFVVVQPSGQGLVIGFTQDPNVRAYLDGLNVIFMNAIFRGSAHARPVR